jgi:hypothetical protein
MLRGMLFGVTTADPLTYLIVLMSLTRVEPLAALRSEN